MWEDPGYLCLPLKYWRSTAGDVVNTNILATFRDVSLVILSPVFLLFPLMFVQQLHLIVSVIFSQTRESSYARLRFTHTHSQISGVAANYAKLVAGLENE